MKKTAGFTLLELLISCALISTLMLVLWSLFGTYTKLESRSAKVAIELQLTRSLSRQLHSDLEHFVYLPTSQNTSGDQDTAQPSPPTGVSSDLETEVTASLRDNNPTGNPTSSTVLPGILSTQSAAVLDHSYLRGTATRLELITRRPYTLDIPVDVTQVPSGETRYATQFSIVYEWIAEASLTDLLALDPVLQPTSGETRASSTTDNTSELIEAVPMRLNPNDSVGLTRESKSWLQVSRERFVARNPAAGAQTTAVTTELSTIDSQFPPQSTLPSEGNTLSASQANSIGAETVWAPPAPVPMSREHLPEVTRLQFRYFDGASWQLEWQQTDRLPRAIEIALDIDPSVPAAREKKYAAAHSAILAGATTSDVLPTQDQSEPVDDVELEPAIDLADPTALRTEYRFVVALPSAEASRLEEDSRQ